MGQDNASPTLSVLKVWGTPESIVPKSTIRVAPHTRISLRGASGQEAKEWHAAISN